MKLWAGFTAFLDRMTGHGRRTLALPDPLAMATCDAAAVQPVSRAQESAMEAEARRRRRQAQLRARVANAFAPSQPVDTRDALCGRSAELRRLFQASCEGHLHSLIFGPRGSGKTSLARVFGDYADERGFTVIYLSCAGGGSFTDLMLPYLKELPAQSFGMTPAEYVAAMQEAATAMTPRLLASMLSSIADEDVILILDEFDRVESADIKDKLASLIKLLSDMRARVRLLFVGISGNIEDLIGAHQSVRRHLAAVAVGPLADVAVDTFLDEAGRSCGVAFAGNAQVLVRWMVRGSPYHMRLFCLRAAMIAIESGTMLVQEDAVEKGAATAYEDWRITNVRDAELFEQLAIADQPPRGLLEAVAQLAISTVNFNRAQLAALLLQLNTTGTTTAETLIDVLRPALRTLPGVQEHYTFEDALAPQYLLAACVIYRPHEQRIERGKVSEVVRW